MFGDYQSQLDLSSADNKCLHKAEYFMEIHFVLVEIFQFGPKWLTFQQTDGPSEQTLPSNASMAKNRLIINHRQLLQ